MRRGPSRTFRFKPGEDEIIVRVAEDEQGWVRIRIDDPHDQIMTVILDNEEIHWRGRLRSTSTSPVEGSGQ